MEQLIKEMQDEETGVPVRSQKVFLSSIPAAFAGYDIIEWLMERLNIEDSGKITNDDRKDTLLKLCELHFAIFSSGSNPSSQLALPTWLLFPCGDEQ